MSTAVGEAFFDYRVATPDQTKISLSAAMARIREAQGAAPPPGPSVQIDPIDRLRQLADLLQRGAISQDEFELLKASVMREVTGR